MLIVVILAFAVVVPMCHLFSSTASNDFIPMRVKGTTENGDYSIRADDPQVLANNGAVILFSECPYTVAVNEPFNVTIMVENVSALDTWQVRVLFDPNVLQYVTTTIPSDNVLGSRIIFAYALENGSLMLGACVQGYEDGRALPSFTGTGKLVTVTFIMKTIDTTVIGLDASDRETFLLTSTLSKIQRSVVGSSVCSLPYVSDVNSISVGIEKLVLKSYAESIAKGWNLHLAIENTGNVPATFDNSTVFIGGSSASSYAKYTPIENFSQVTIQPGVTTELLIFLPAGAGSPWQEGITLRNYVLTFPGNLYSNDVVLP
jgi:hypothetical protein